MANPTAPLSLLVPPVVTLAQLAAEGERGPAAVPAAADRGTDATLSYATPGLPLDVALHHLKETLAMASVNVEFEIDPDSHRIITKVIARDTGEVIRQIPTEEVLRIGQAWQHLQGLFVHQKI